MVESLRCQLPFSLAGVRDQFNGPLRPALLRFRVLTDFRLQLLSSPEPFDRYFEGEADGVRCESQGVIWDPMNLPFGGSKQPHIFLSTLRRLLFGRSTTQYDLCSPHRWRNAYQEAKHNGIPLAVNAIQIFSCCHWHRLPFHSARTFKAARADLAEPCLPDRQV